MPSERVIKSAVVIVSATLSIWLTARGCTMLLAAQLIKPVAARSQQAIARRAEPNSAKALGEKVLVRNMFDAETGGMAWLASGQANHAQGWLEAAGRDNSAGRV